MVAAESKKSSTKREEREGKLCQDSSLLVDFH
jgi:hypothetical protein